MASTASTQRFTVFDAGGLRIGITTVTALWQVISARFGSHACAGPAMFEVVCEVDGPLPAGLASATAVHTEPHAVQSTSEGFVVRGTTFTVTANLGAARMLVRGPAAAYPIDAALRYLLPVLLDDGLVFHATALADDENAWLCTGPSGSGKSTLAGLFPDRALCDELAVVRRGGAGWQLHSLPYWRSRPAELPLAGICALRRGATDQRSPLTGLEAVRRLSATVSWPSARPVRMAETLRLVAALAEEVPIFDLAFRPDPTVWRVLAEGWDR